MHWPSALAAAALAQVLVRGFPRLRYATLADLGIGVAVVFTYWHLKRSG
jgi:hypothetical protein